MNAITALRPVAAPASGLAFTPLHPAFGAEVEGLDLTRDIPAATLRTLRQALRRDLLLVIRHQSLTPDALVDFTARLGTLARHPLAELLLPARPEIVVEHSDDRDRLWHADLSWSAEPNRVSALAAGEPGAEGGITEFASLVEAYARLDPWLRDRIEYLEVEHDHPRRAAAGQPRPVHPLIRIDPDTGRRALMLDSGTARRIIGLPQGESDSLLQRLLASATRPGVTLRHHWQPGDLVLWDNRAILHRSHGATLLRTMTAGSRPVGPRETTTAWVSAG